MSPRTTQCTTPALARLFNIIGIASMLMGISIFKGCSVVPDRLKKRPILTKQQRLGRKATAKPGEALKKPDSKKPAAGRRSRRPARSDRRSGSSTSRRLRRQSSRSGLVARRQPRRRLRRVAKCLPSPRRRRRCPRRPTLQSDEVSSLTCGSTKKRSSTSPQHSRQRRRHRPPWTWPWRRTTRQRRRRSSSTAFAPPASVATIVMSRMTSVSSTRESRQRTSGREFVIFESVHRVWS
mmetsp:Transcript_4470/g.14003  ORF Transcript_4470/g.14003 Transcript_4470/m.14003 type:complete len:237 (+) Transcript_4470:577-1287(+)